MKPIEIFLVVLVYLQFFSDKRLFKKIVYIAVDNFNKNVNKVFIAKRKLS